MIKIGNDKIGAVYHGGTPISKIYKGGELVYSANLNGFRFKANRSTSIAFYINSVEKTVSSVKDTFVFVPVSNLTDMFSMFNAGDASYITDLDVSMLDTSMVTSMQKSFQTLEYITSLDVSNFDTSKTTDMQYMFSGCSRIEHLDLSSFVAQKNCRKRYMFQNCSSLKSLDLSNFYIYDGSSENILFHEYMFVGCDSLTHIKCRQAFKNICQQYPDISFLPNTMQSGGSGTWEIVD